MPYSTFLLLSFLSFIPPYMHSCMLLRFWVFSTHRVQLLKCKSELVEAGGPAYGSSVHITQREWQHIQTRLLPECYVMLVWSSCYSTSSCFEITATILPCNTAENFKRQNSTISVGRICLMTTKISLRSDNKGKSLCMFLVFSRGYYVCFASHSHHIDVARHSSKWPKYRASTMPFTDCYRGFLFPVKMQHLPQLMSLFPVSSSFSSSIAHPELWVWLLTTSLTTADSAQSFQPLNSDYHFQATNCGACHMGDTGGAPCHQIPSVRSRKGAGFLNVWSGWARDSMASKTHWNCDRLFLRRLYSPLDKASAAMLASMKRMIPKIPLSRGREKSTLTWITKKKRHT